MVQFLTDIDGDWYEIIIQNMGSNDYCYHIFLAENN